MNNLIHLCARSIAQKFFSVDTVVVPQPTDGRIKIDWEGKPHYMVFFTEEEMLITKDALDAVCETLPARTLTLDHIAERFVV